MTSPNTIISKTFADYATQKPTYEHGPFIAHDESGFRKQEQSCIHIRETVWDTSLKEWVSLGKKNNLRPKQPRPREWPKTWQWPFDVMRNRENVDGPCLNCGRGAKDACSCKPSQWRIKTDWEPLRALVGTQNAGVGVKTLTAWRKDDILGDYVGELRPFNDTEDNQYSLLVPLRRQGSSPTVAMIDATRAGNWTRFINHTSDDPNLEIVISRIGQQRVFILKARRDINWGEELRFNYGMDWKFPEPELYVSSEDEVDLNRNGEEHAASRVFIVPSKENELGIERYVVESIAATDARKTARRPDRLSGGIAGPNSGRSRTTKRVRIEEPTVILRPPSE